MRTAVQNSKFGSSFKCLLLISVVSALFLSGCGGFPTNWKKKHQALNVEHQNLRGLLERERAEKGQFAERASKDQQTIAELQKQIIDRKKTAADATGFGKGYDVKFDASAGTITVTLSNKILFKSGQAALKKSTITELNHIHSVLQRKYPGIGTCCNTGKGESRPFLF